MYYTLKIVHFGQFFQVLVRSPMRPGTQALRYDGRLRDRGMDIPVAAASRPLSMPADAACSLRSQSALRALLDGHVCDRGMDIPVAAAKRPLQQPRRRESRTKAKPE